MSRLCSQKLKEVGVPRVKLGAKPSSHLDGDELSLISIALQTME